MSNILRAASIAVSSCRQIGIDGLERYRHLESFDQPLTDPKAAIRRLCKLSETRSNRQPWVSGSFPRIGLLDSLLSTSDRV